MFTPVAEGLSDITITDLKVRDVDNAPLTSSMVGGVVRIDCTVPTMEPITEAEGECYNVAPPFANFGFDDDQALDWAQYQIDAGGWVTLFTGLDLPEWNDDGWALPGFRKRTPLRSYREGRWLWPLMTARKPAAAGSRSISLSS